MVLKHLEGDISIIFNRADLFYYSGTGLEGIILARENNLTRYIQRNFELGEKESVLHTKEMPSFRIFKELGKEISPETLGLELDILPYRTVEYIKNSFNNPEIIDIGSQLRKIRSVKSQEEQEYMKKAAKQTDESFEYIEDQIKPGITELELSAEIEKFLRKEGHPGYVNIRTFQHNYTTSAYVMAGDSTATLNTNFGPVSGQGLCKLHKNGPSRRKIRNDDAVLIDTTGVVEGYTADETRTFFIGNPSPILLEAYEAAKAVQNTTAKILRAGAEPEKIYHEIWDVVKEFDLDNNFMGRKDDIVPFVGHGVGLELDEFPIITPKYTEPLEKGNLVAMEPKFIFDNPSSGVGIEDTWIIKENGAEKITQFPW